MAIDLTATGKCYTSTRRTVLQDGTVRLWKIELRPADMFWYNNRSAVDALPDYEEFHDLFVSKVECMKSELELQMGLVTPPTIKITCNANFATEAFVDMVEQVGDYENYMFWAPTYDEADTRPIYNTWAIKYSDNDGEDWYYWFVGVQQPNEVTKYTQADSSTDSAQEIVLTVQHIQHWILSQVEYWTWGKQLRKDAEDDELFDWRLANIAYDTVFSEGIVERRGSTTGSTYDETIHKTVNVSENWGLPDAANMDEAWFVRWVDAWESLRGIINRGLFSHRIHAASEDVFSPTPCQLVMDGMPYNFFKQDYDHADGFLGDALDTDEIWIIAAVKPRDEEDPFFGLFFNTMKASGAGFDGETCVDALMNIAKGMAMKVVYGFGGSDEDAQYSVNSRGLRGTVNTAPTLVALDVFERGWEFARGEFVRRGAAFNVSAEDKNDTEFRVYAAGNQDREDIERKMQLHNLPNIRDWVEWSNTDASGLLKSYRQAGYTLRRLWYLDEPPRLHAAPEGWADGMMPIRAHEYVEFYDGVRTWDDTHGNPFTAIPRSYKTLAADMLKMQRESGMPLITAKILSAIFSRPGCGALKCSIPIALADYNDVGSEFVITVPSEFKRMQGGKFYLESIEPNLETLRNECVFIFIPDDPS